MKELSDGKIRFIGKAIVKGCGSEMRSGKCPFEFGCVYFEINGVSYRWFTDKFDNYNSRKFYNKTFDIKAIATTSRTLQHVKFM